MGYRMVFEVECHHCRKVKMFAATDEQDGIDYAMENGWVFDYALGFNYCPEVADQTAEELKASGREVRVDENGGRFLVDF